MKAKEIANTIKEKPYRDGEALIKQYLYDFLLWYEVTEYQNPNPTNQFLISAIARFDSDFYCENKIDEAMLQCGEQCDTCKNQQNKNEKANRLERRNF
jgi:hypothetical protein